MDLGVSGLASGFDWRTFVDQLADVERAPQQRLRTEQGTMAKRQQAYASLTAELVKLQTTVDALKEASLFGSRSASVSDATVASIATSAGALQGSYDLEVVHLAKAAVWRGTSGISAGISSTDITDSQPDPDTSPAVGSADFAQKITAGDFTVNGHRVTIAATDTLRQVFQKISDATGGEVTASYTASSDTITLSSAGNIILGSPTDSSNFLQAARLYKNGTSAITSASGVAGLSLSGPLDSIHTLTEIDDGGSGKGEFKINGVTIYYNAATDSMADVLARINQSKAGVQASYDAVNDQVVLTNKTTGDVGISLEKVTGNFLEAAGLTTGSLQRGQNLEYRINGGGLLSTTSNTITESSSGLAGMSITALKEGTATLTVSVDKDKIKQAVTSFLEAYNKVQGLIDTQTSSTTDADGKVTAGVLAGDGDATKVAMQLRSLASGAVSLAGLSIDRLDDLGITTSGYSNNLTLSDESALMQAIEENSADLQSFFSGEDGWASAFSDYLKKTAGEDGTLAKDQDNIIKQSAKMDVQIANMERIVLANRQRLIDSFVNMESAQAKLNQQLTFLQKQLASFE